MPNINTETENIIEKENVIENIIGMAFLTSQTYINGTIADIKFFSIKPDEINKWLLFKKYGKLLPGNNVTSIELCYAYANYGPKPKTRLALLANEFLLDSPNQQHTLRVACDRK